MINLKMDRDVDSTYKLFSNLAVAVLLKRQTGQNFNLASFKNKPLLQNLADLYALFDSYHEFPK